MSQTYVQITHHHAEKLSKTNPDFIGLNYTPFPNPSISPETSLLQADDIPRCLYCSAFFNKFNKFDENQFICSLCGSKNKFKTPNIYKNPYSNPTNSNIYIPSFNGCTNFGGTNSLDNQGVFSAECKNEVYEAIARDKFKSRLTNFVPTTYFYISLSLMKSHPEIFNCIDTYLQQCYQPRQFGICFLHGALTLVKLRPSPEFQTYLDDAPECRSPLYYVSAPYFRSHFQTVINKASELTYIEKAYEDEYVKNVIEHSKKVSLLFGTHVYYILDEKDFNMFSTKTNKDFIKLSSLQMVKKNVQASVIIFASQNRLGNYTYRNPLLDFTVITGGVFKIFPEATYNLNNTGNNNNICNMYNDFLNVLNFPSFHDTFIFICPPVNSPLSDFAGQGMMKSHTGISTSKIKYNDSFSFKFDPSDSDDNPYIQFVTYYTTNDNVRRMRVTTVPILKYPTVDLNAQIDYCSTFIAQRFLLEGKEQAQKLLDSLKKWFKDISFRFPEIIINDQNLFQSDQIALYGFNKTLYGNNPMNNTSNMNQQNQMLLPPSQQQQIQSMQIQQQQYQQQLFQQQQQQLPNLQPQNLYSQQSQQMQDFYNQQLQYQQIPQQYYDQSQFYSQQPDIQQFYIQQPQAQQANAEQLLQYAEPQLQHVVLLQHNQQPQSADQYQQQNPEQQQSTESEQQTKPQQKNYKFV